jgi:hypothetical protein
MKNGAFSCKKGCILFLENEKNRMKKMTKNNTFTFYVHVLFLE